MANSALPASALPVGRSGERPLLRVVSPQGLSDTLRAQEVEAARVTQEGNDAVEGELARHIRTEWEMMRNHRNSASGWADRLLHAQRVFNGEYDAQKLMDIRAFGGTEIYASLTALKARGATALLREVYVSKERPWALQPTPEPTLPDDIISQITQLVDMETQSLAAAGQQIDINALRDRTTQLTEGAMRAARKNAEKQAKDAERKLDDLLVEGNFYEALVEALTDIPLFPFCCIKGPVVRIVPDVRWRGGKPVTEQRARLFWERKSPFDIYWTPGVSKIADAAMIERMRLTRTDLNDLLGLPGYNEENIRKVLDEYGRGGLRDWADTTDQPRAESESRESPAFNRSSMIDCLEYHGNVQGRTLIEYGVPEGDGPTEISDPDRDYCVQAWLVGRYIIKAQISPNPRKRHPYFITSFEKVPGTPIGKALPDILKHIEEAANATLRNLVNNMSISSGPQVVVDEERLSPLEDGDTMYPWKRWRVKSDPFGNANSSASKPIEFFSPQSHAQELFALFKEWHNLADELSAIPRYITGSDKLGGAGRTASGLAMLMGNASKILQMVAGNIDNDIMEPSLTSLYDMVMLTDTTGMFRGDETIRVRGVEVAVQRETERQRQIEALNATANPFDMQVLGLPGRAKLLRAVLENIGVDDDIVPPESDLQAALAGQTQGVPGMPGAPPPAHLLGGAGQQGQQPGGANTGLGVQDANAMRGMA